MIYKKVKNLIKNFLSSFMINKLYKNICISKTWKLIIIIKSINSKILKIK